MTEVKASPMSGLKMARQTTAKMRTIATAFLESLDREQRQMAMIDFADEAERRDWDFIPKQGRNGLPLRLMTNHQQTMAHMLLAASVSLTTYAKVLQIMANESLLRELQGPRMGPAATEFRNPGNYYFSVFARPNLESTWGWRVVGHHVSLNFTVVAGVYLAATPCLLGMEPAEFGVMKPLREDEDLGFDLLYALSDEQHRRAVIHDIAPPNFATRVVPHLGQEELPGDHELGFDAYVISDHDRQRLRYVRTQPRGVAARELDEAQRGDLERLVECFVARLPEEVAEIEMDRLRTAGLENVHFCWAGQLERGTPHYYRLQGPSFLVEFENAQSGGNHIHTVWRDPNNDFGDDFLARHHAEAHEHTPFLIDRVTSSVE
jgi:hypothetical protein